MDLGQLVGIVFIDLKKAFDTVDHKIPCKKLDLCGVRDVNSLGLNTIFQAGKSFLGSMALIQKLGT